ncbi:hypothetical protein Glove_410g26 [Diversispora epigaea]|uniref:Uncharacterized protein n=1 Tax=Diversispora epigaea TaxID=1348612 RepID=A0A397GYW9_9GLOM|nr:hypothetical protein Glove_410g26 [Diversispora epigaea]
MWRAFCYCEIQFYNHALWDLDLIIKSGYADAFTYLNRADINRRLKKFKDANEDISKAFCFKNVNKALGYGISGELKLDCGEFQDAINDLNKALKFQPDNAIALRNRCESYRMLMDPENALEDLNKLCILEPENDYQYELKGAILLDMRKWNASLKNFNKAIKSLPNNVVTIDGILIDPRNLIIRQQSMDLHRRTNQYDMAIGEAEAVLMIDHKNISTLLIRADALKFQPDNAIALRNRCESYRMLMDPENALEDLNKLCILEPENDYQYELKGAILLDMRKWNASLKNFNKAIKSLPNNVVTIDGILIDPRNLIIRQQSMDLHRRTNQYDMAIGEAEAVLMIDHKNISTLLIRADVYFLKRKYNYSLVDLDNANRIAPKNSFVLISRGELFCKMKYYGDALYNVQCALEIKSADHYTLEVRGNIYRKQHKYEEALVDYNKSLELYPLDMILEHDQNQNGKKESCKVEGGKDDKDSQDLLVRRNNVGYDKGFVVTQQIFGERNFSRIYYQRGDTYYKLGMYELALKDLNRALELASGYAPIYKKRAYILHKLESLNDTYIY